MSLYEITMSLQSAKGSLAKQAILNANTSNDLLKGYMKAVYDNSVIYYQATLPKCTATGGTREFDQSVIDFVLEQYAGRQVTGDAAKRSLHALVGNLNAEGVVLLGLLIKRSIGASVGETMVLKAWPGLFSTVPYMRCAGMSPKVKEEYAALPHFFVQTKMDGAFAYCKVMSDGTRRLFTRNGMHYPEWLANRIGKMPNMGKNSPTDIVIMGELLVSKAVKGNSFLKLQSRKVGNGVLNSLLQGGDGDESKYKDTYFHLVAWDTVTVDEFEAGVSDRPYHDRLDFSQAWYGCMTHNITLINYHKVTSLKQAFALHREALLRGEEGTVWKKPDGIWRDSSSGTRDAVKVKIKFEAEFVVTGKYEGEGKAKGMLGGFNITSSCGMISNNVGSGFSDAQRKEYWAADTDGWIVTLEANDVIDRTGSTTESLFLPIFVERRLDKTVADTRQRVLEQLQAAKEGS